jgi:phenylacetate-CoA ligase
MFLRAAARGLSERHKASVKRLLSFVAPRWRQGGTYWRWHRFLNIAQHWPRSRIESWQLERLRRVVRHAYDHTDGYRELYRSAGVSPDDINSLADIEGLPFTTKKMLRDDLEAFSVRHRGRVYLTTGGSTGIPFGFYEDTRDRQIENAFMHIGWSEVGWRLDLWSAVLRGAFVGARAYPWKRDPYSREISLSSYFLTPDMLEKYVEILQRYKPPVLQAYPSSLNILSDLLLESRPSQRITFDIILLGSENMYDWQLAKIRKAFPNSRPFAWYGQAERVILAPWCARREEYHAWPFYGLTEIVDPEGAQTPGGGEGELVGTSFHNLVTPFIRYRTMDRAVRGSAACDLCGRQFQLLSRIAGRAHEMIVTRSGRFISMTAINMHDDIFDLVRQFQFVQEHPGKVLFQYVPRRTLAALELSTLTARLMVKLGDDMELQLEPVEKIPRAPSGKYRFLDQRLVLRYGDQ